MASIYSLVEEVLGVKTFKVKALKSSYDRGRLSELRMFVVGKENREKHCPHCGRPCSGYDKGSKRLHTWRALDWNGTRIFIQSYLSRIRCPDHGIVTESVPWAFPGSDFTKEFDCQIAYDVFTSPKSKISKKYRIDWKTVGRCIARTLHWLEPDPTVRYNNLVRIGIDETSYKKGHKYLTNVVDHDRNRIVWSHDGYGKEVLSLFFKELTPEQLSSIKFVSADGAQYITDCVNQYIPHATRCMDPFHVAQWIVEAIDKLRRDEVRSVKEIIEQLNQEMAEADTEEERQKYRNLAADTRRVYRIIKRSKYALGKGKENLTEHQTETLSMILVNNRHLNRAYQLKELLRLILRKTDRREVEADLDAWIFSASRSRIEPIVALANRIKDFKQSILDTISSGVTNARIEAMNSKIKLLVRIGRGFRSMGNLQALIRLVCSDLTIPLPHQVPGKLEAA